MALRLNVALTSLLTCRRVSAERYVIRERRESKAAVARSVRRDRADPH